MGDTPLAVVQRTGEQHRPERFAVLPILENLRIVALRWQARPLSSPRLGREQRASSPTFRLIIPQI